MKILIYLITVMLLSVVSYSVFAFVANEINAFQWHWAVRALFALSFLGIAAIVAKNLRDETI